MRHLDAYIVICSVMLMTQRIKSIVYFDFYQYARELLPAFFTLFFGGTIYVLFRSDDIYFIDWLINQKIGPSLIEARSISIKFRSSLPHWFLFSLPDALWMLSLSLLMLNFWKNESFQNQMIWSILVPLIALLWEFAQYFNFLKGTFDWVDIHCYLIATTIIFLKLKTIKHEKTNAKIN